MIFDKQKFAAAAPKIVAVILTIDALVYGVNFFLFVLYDILYFFSVTAIMINLYLAGQLWKGSQYHQRLTVMWVFVLWGMAGVFHYLVMEDMAFFGVHGLHVAAVAAPLIGKPGVVKNVLAAGMYAVYIFDIFGMVMIPNLMSVW